MAIFIIYLIHIVVGKFGKVKFIRRYAFEECDSLEEIDLRGVEDIEEDAFHGCYRLKRVIIDSNTTYRDSSRDFSFCDSFPWNAEIIRRKSDVMNEVKKIK